MLGMEPRTLYVVGKPLATSYILRLTYVDFKGGFYETENYRVK